MGNDHGSLGMLLYVSVCVVCECVGPHVCYIVCIYVSMFCSFHSAVTVCSKCSRVCMSTCLCTCVCVPERHMMKRLEYFTLLLYVSVHINILSVQCVCVCFRW